VKCVLCACEAGPLGIESFKGTDLAEVQFHLTSEQKQAVLEAVFYEVEQLLAASLIKTNDIYINNALLESTLVHARILLDFFEKSRRATYREGNRRTELDDVLAVDYGFVAQEVQIPPNDRERLNKDLAHLTYSRATRKPKDRWWDYTQVVYPILTRSREFVEHLLSNWLLADNVEATLACRNLLKRIERRINSSN
jgi:hypothetical protein